MTIKITIKKYDLPRFAALRGMVNRNTYDGHLVGTLRFIGFVGRHVGAGWYEGELVFESVAAGSVKRSCSFSDSMRSLPDTLPRVVSRVSYKRRGD